MGDPFLNYFATLAGSGVLFRPARGQLRPFSW